MGNLAVDVVKQMRLRDTVGGMRAELSHDRAQKMAVEGGKSATSESGLEGTVVRKQRIGVLEEGDQKWNITYVYAHYPPMHKSSAAAARGRPCQSRSQPPAVR